MQIKNLNTETREVKDIIKLYTESEYGWWGINYNENNMSSTQYSTSLVDLHLFFTLGIHLIFLLEPKQLLILSAGNKVFLRA